MSAVTAPKTGAPASAAYQLARLVAGLPTPAANGEASTAWMAVIQDVERAPLDQRLAILQAELARHGLEVEPTLKAIAAIKPDAPPPPAARVSAYTADALLDAELPDPEFLVPERITEGLVILAGRMKMGKSWLALLLSCALGTGGMFLGKQARKGKVAYFALEDPPKRLKRRMHAMGWPRGATVDFFFDLAPLGGILAGLPAFMEVGTYNLAVLDTLGRALPAGVKSKETSEMTPILDPIQRAAGQQGRTVLAIDHYRKPAALKSEGGDHLDEVMDSSAKVAVADTIIGLARKRGERGATLKITGRDLEEDLELAIEHDRETGCWQLIGEAAEVRQTVRQRKVIAGLKTLLATGQTPNAKNLGEASGLDKASVSQVVGELIELQTVRPLPKIGRDQCYELVKP